jgi:hypothetical protein
LGSEGLFVDINTAFAGDFGENPNVNPVPFIGNDKRLLDTPVVTASTNDGLFELKIARGRIDLFRNARAEESSYEETHENLMTNLTKLLQVLDGKVEVDWIGFINNYIFSGDVKKCSDKLFNSSVVNINGGETSTYFMRHANVLNIHDIPSNNQISVGTGSSKQNGGEKIDGLIITQDFNSKPTPSNVDVAFVESYINEAKELIKIDEIVTLIS